MSSDRISELESKLQRINTEIEPLSLKLQDPRLFNDPQESKKVGSAMALLQNRSKLVQDLLLAYKNQLSAEEVLNAETDPELVDMAKAEIAELNAQITQKEASLKELEVPPEPHDSDNAIIEIRAGTGGEEAALFAYELFRAYSKFCQVLGLEVEIADTSYSATGGFKEVIFFVNGLNAYKQFKFESGVHRVQRVPATESSGRIHTSAVSVVVLPEIEEVEVEIKPEDLRIDVYRSSGPGGQSVNTTDSAVRIVHLPTNIIVTCQDEKSQHKNKAKAMKILAAKLYDIQRHEAEEKLGAIRQQAIKTGDRSDKIRTYNFPQSRVTDHRIKVSWHNLSEILEGNFATIVNALAVGLAPQTEA